MKLHSFLLSLSPLLPWPDRPAVSWGGKITVQDAHQREGITWVGTLDVSKIHSERSGGNTSIAGHQ